MLKEFEERIENAKNKQFRMLERFHIGDAVYPFWLKNFIVYGIVIDVDTVARKVICDFNGVRRQFCPEDLMHVNPELINASTDKKRNASAKRIDRNEYNFYVVLNDGSIESGWEFKEDATDRKKELAEDSVSSKVLTRRSLSDKPLDDNNWHKGAITASVKNDPDGAYSKFDETHLSEDTDNGIRAKCKKCGGEIAVSYDEKTATSDFVCTKCGHRIPEDKLSQETKKAMRRSQERSIKASGIVADDEDDGYLKLNDAFEALTKAYPEKLDYDMGWRQDIYRGVIYINYYSGFEDDGFEVTFNIEYNDGKFTVQAIDLEGTCVVGPDSYDGIDAMVEGFKSYFPTVDEHVRTLQDKESGDYYDAGHAAEWMEKNPHGWYNSENDKGTGNEDDGKFASKKAIAQELARVAKMLMKRD